MTFDHFHRAKISSIPAPGAVKIPLPSVRSEQGTKAGQLKPANIKLAGQLSGRGKATNVCAPERCSAQRRIQADRYMSSQCIPERKYISRPQPATIALHPGIACPMKAKGTLPRLIG